MFLLFFLMVAAGMLGLLWLYFPVQGGLPPDAPPPRPPVSVPATPAEVPAAPTVPAAAATTAGATDATGPVDATAVADRAGERSPVAADAAPAASPSGRHASPATQEITSIEELDRQLDKLLGRATPPGPARP